MVALLVVSSGVLTEAAEPEQRHREQAAVITVPPRRDGPVTAAVSIVRIGPSEDYPALGTLPAGAFLEVLGRDQTGTWLAISFPPNSGFRGWLPASRVTGIDVGAALQVVEVVPLR